MASLEVKHLVKDFRLQGGRGKRFRAVDDVSFTLEPGKTIALVGESGSGKSTIARMIAKLETPSSGDILLDGKVSATRGRGLAGYRHDVQMVFQDPFASLNPFHTIQHHLERPLRLHGRVKGQAEADAEVERLLERVSLTPAAGYARRSPHELSGGQRQRVWVAMALAQQTKHLLLDEPTTFLDIAHQIDLMELFAGLHRQGTTLVAVLHDLNHAARYATHLVAMRDGTIVAQGDPREIITADLVEAVYDLPCRVIVDPVAGTPLVLPLGRRRP